MAALDRPVRHLVTERLVRVVASLSLRAAAVELDGELVGAVLVDGAEGPFGMLTERDLVRALADGADPDDSRVADYVTDDLLTVDEFTPLWDVLRRMRTNQVRHVVVTRHDEIAGVVSMRAVVEAALAQHDGSLDAAVP